MEPKPVDPLSFLYIQRLYTVDDGGSGWRDEGAQQVMRDDALTLACATERMHELAHRMGGAWRIINKDGAELATLTRPTVERERWALAPQGCVHRNCERDRSVNGSRCVDCGLQFHNFIPDGI